ncbi:alcohol dehydrogenase [Mesorhizobium sp. ANAO-SY3R2]|uniref:alcohol dehydrogenase n=1 Tax=Mesorhizobium sp. ANAO-SY3R2 TaxID=3166644 RepID=UPI00366C0D2F
MRSFAVKMFCEPVEPMDTPDLRPKGSEVVIEVTHCGVCHSDLHLQDGVYNLGRGKTLSLADRGVKLPLVPGHEIVGRLVAIGPDAPIGADQIGRYFGVYPWLGCGECEVCRRGDENLCTAPAAIGIHRAGGYAEQCLVTHPRYLIDVDGLDHPVAAIYACSGLTAYSALRKAPIDRDKDWLLIIGAGGVGQNAIHIAKALGQRNIAVVDIDPAKREAARQSGAGIVLDSGDATAAATLKDLPGGVAATVDFVGSSETASFGIDVLRKSGLYVAVGLYGGEVSLPLPLLVLRSIGIKGSYVGNLAELKELFELAKGGSLGAIPIETVPMASANAALDRLRGGQAEGRLVLTRD